MDDKSPYRQPYAKQITRSRRKNVGKEFPYMDPVGQPVFPAISEIIPQKLYLGDMEGATSAAVLAQHEITLVVTICTREERQRVKFPQRAEHLVLDLNDAGSCDISQHFEPSNAAIGRCIGAGGKAFVHCVAGVSRSPTLVMAYLLHTGHAPTLRAAYELVYAARPCVSPNLGFMRQLQKLEQPKVENPEVEK